jgi:hypothetical protein
VTNTLGYYDTQSIAVMKRFVVKGPSVIWEKKLRMFCKRFEKYFTKKDFFLFKTSYKLLLGAPL